MDSRGHTSGTGAVVSARTDVSTSEKNSASASASLFSRADLARTMLLEDDGCDVHLPSVIPILNALSLSSGPLDHQA